MTKDNSPYLLVDSEKGMEQASSEHVGNPMLAAAAASSASASPVSKPEAEASQQPPMPFASTRALVFHVVQGLLAFLAFIVMGATNSGVSVSSGAVSVSGLLSSASCKDDGPISGELSFNSHRFVLVIGILTWLYCMTSVFLALVKRAAAFFLNKLPKTVDEDKLNFVALVADVTFSLLSFIAFLAGAVYITVPQKLVFGDAGQAVYFTIETFWMTVSDLGLCDAKTTPNPLPAIRASIALIFFSAAAGGACIITQVQAYREQQKLKRQDFTNVL
jgi:hypothetical protein